MMTTKTKHRYTLDGGSKKFRCPSCGKKRFVRYKDTLKDEYLPKQYGRCDRQNSCGYINLPQHDDSFEFDDDRFQQPVEQKQQQPDYISASKLKASLSNYENNNLVRFLAEKFGKDIVRELIRKYYIGTSSHWRGSTVFWQVGANNKVRSGKVMLYEMNGHRKKADDFSYINWIHSLLHGDDFSLDQCFFGEHLLSDDKDAPVAICESEKTAIVASVYLPEFIWLAAGSEDNLKAEKCNCLIGRDVVLYPDVGSYDKWQAKARDMEYFCNVEVNDFLEQHGDDGLDIADYLLEHDNEQFTADETHTGDDDRRLDGKFEADNLEHGLKMTESGYPASFDDVSLSGASQAEKLQATRQALSDLDDDDPYVDNNFKKKLENEKVALTDSAPF